MAFWHFTPPNTTQLSSWAEGADPLGVRLLSHFQRNVQVNNVFIWSDNTVSETQPPYGMDVPDDPTQRPYTARVFYGGHVYSDVTDAEKALLQGAGYTVT